MRDAHAVRNLIEFVEGATTGQLLEGSSVFVSSSSPATWSDGVISSLAGVLIVGEAIATKELIKLKSHRVTYLHVTRQQLDRRSDCSDFGHELAAALYGYSLPALDCQRITCRNLTL